MDTVLDLIQNPSWDIIAFVAIMACGFFWGASYGKRSLGLIVLGVYVLFALWPFVPMNVVTEGRAPIEIWAFRGGVFLALLMLLLLFMFRAFKGVTGSGDGVWWEILLLSALGSGLLITIFLTLAPPQIISDNPLELSKIILQVFYEPVFAMWWMILPVLGVLFL